MGFEVFKSEKNGKYYYRLKARNGEIILQSERGYSSKASAEKGIEITSNNIKQRKIENKVAKNGKEYFVVKADNGKTIAGKSQMYRSKAGVNKGIKSLITNIEASDVKVKYSSVKKNENKSKTLDAKQQDSIVKKRAGNVKKTVAKRSNSSEKKGVIKVKKEVLKKKISSEKKGGSS